MLIPISLIHIHAKEKSFMYFQLMLYIVQCTVEHTFVCCYSCNLFEIVMYYTI